jgi:phosphinothricin acetyltransferase
MSSVFVRAAERRDLEGLLTIYNWAVANTTATMDTDPRSHAAQLEWLEAHDGNPYPALVAEPMGELGTIVGYASLSPYNRKPGYRTSAEVSVYVHPGWHRQGIGNTLLQELITIAPRHGFVSLISLITADNEASLQLHTRHGFENIGTLRQVGRKFDRWVDVTFMQRILPD